MAATKRAATMLGLWCVLISTDLRGASVHGLRNRVSDEQLWPRSMTQRQLGAAPRMARERIPNVTVSLEDVIDDRSVATPQLDFRRALFGDDTHATLRFTVASTRATTAIMHVTPFADASAMRLHVDLHHSAEDQAAIDDLLARTGVVSTPLAAGAGLLLLGYVMLRHRWHSI